MDREVGIEAEDGGGGGLAVAVHDQDPVASDGQIVGEVGGHRRFPDAALEVLHGDDRRRVVRPASRGGAQHLAHVEEGGDAVAEPPARFAFRRRGKAAVLLGHANPIG